MIELLLIIVIILVIATCMTPFYLHQRAETAKLKCVSNMKAVSQALLQYTALSDDTLPMAYYSKGDSWSYFATKPTTDSSASLWADVLTSMAPNLGTYQCPSDSLLPIKARGNSLSYALNSYFYIQPGGVHRQEFNGGGLSEVPDVRAKLLLVESTTGIGNELATPNSAASKAWTRHLGGVNWIFGDGHAEYHEPPQTWVGAGGDWLDPAQAAKQNYPQWLPWAPGNPRW